jgi:hypothetical protein
MTSTFPRADRGLLGRRLAWRTIAYVLPLAAATRAHWRPSTRPAPAPPEKSLAAKAFVGSYVWRASPRATEGESARPVSDEPLAAKRPSARF